MIILIQVNVSRILELLLSIKHFFSQFDFLLELPDLIQKLSDLLYVIGLNLEFASKHGPLDIELKVSFTLFCDIKTFTWLFSVLIYVLYDDSQVCLHEFLGSDCIHCFEGLEHICFADSTIFSWVKDTKEKIFNMI